MKQAKNTLICMASPLSSNGHISPNFETIHLKLSTHAYFTVLFYSTGHNIKILEIYFYDIIISALYIKEIKTKDELKFCQRKENKQITLYERNEAKLDDMPKYCW